MQYALGAVWFRQDVAVGASVVRAWSLDFTIAEAEAVRRKVAARIEGCGEVHRVNCPDAAVVEENEINIQSISSGKVQKGNRVVVSRTPNGDRSLRGAALRENGRAAGKCRE